MLASRRAFSFISRVNIFIRKMSLDTSPPLYTGPLDPFNTDLFQKHIPTLAVRVEPKKVHTVLNSPVLRKYVSYFTVLFHFT